MTDLRTLAARTEELLQESGWAKWQLTSSEGKHCVGGALNLVLTGQDGWDLLNADAVTIYREFAGIIQANPEWANRAVCLYAPGNHIGSVATIAQWNNHPATTREDITAALTALGEKELVHAG